MKELTIEQKAKAYDEAIERAKDFHSRLDEQFQKEVEHIFPELAESEDERIIRDIRVVLERSATNAFKENGQMPIWYDRAIAWLEKQGEQKDILEDATLDNNEDGLIADTIKAKGEQKPTEWSEEDEKIIGDIINDIAIAEQQVLDKARCEEEIDWLKSLRPHWKPSDEQMKALNYVINFMASSESPKENDYYYNVFKGLREQLKKL